MNKPIADLIGAQLNGLATLLQITEEIRDAGSVQEARFRLANDLRRLAPYRQAALVDIGSKRLVSVSDVPSAEAGGAYETWVQKVAACIEPGEGPLAFTQAEMPATLANDWPTHFATNAAALDLYCGYTKPLRLLLTRESAFSEAELRLFDRASKSAAHSIEALAKGVGAKPKRRFGAKYAAAAAFTILTFILLLPANDFAVGPAETTARNPIVIRAPLSAVIDRVFVNSQEKVEAGDKIVQFDDSEIRASKSLAEEALKVAAARLRHARLGAFGSAQSKASISLLEAELQMSAQEAAFHAARLEETTLYASRSGVVLHDGREALEGAVVTIGEQLGKIADPSDSELTIWLAIADAIEINAGDPVRFFIDGDTGRPLSAEVVRADWKASLSQEGVLSRRIEARFTKSIHPSVGAVGSARITGLETVLGLALFRKPLSKLRQWIGY